MFRYKSVKVNRSFSVLFSEGYVVFFTVRGALLKFIDIEETRTTYEIAVEWLRIDLEFLSKCLKISNS